MPPDVTERGSIAENMRTHMADVLGVERARRVCSAAGATPAAAPADAVLRFTRSLVEALEAQTVPALSGMLLAFGLSCGLS